MGVRGVLISLRNSEGSGVGVVISDDRGDFRSGGCRRAATRRLQTAARRHNQSPGSAAASPLGVGLFLNPTCRLRRASSAWSVLVGAALMDSGE
ncbi:MAG: hypothetical protein R2856_35400 [Caldilineaceae bacterium]